MTRTRSTSPRFAWLFDIGSTFTKLAVVNLDDVRMRYRAQSPTTVATDVQDGFFAAVRQVEVSGGPRFADAAFRAASSSAAGGLALVVSGLVARLSAEAGRIAALGAGAKLVGVRSFVLTIADVEQLATLKPDIILLAGGTDGGERETLLANAEALARWSGCPSVIVAGNRVVAADAAAILAAAGIAATVVANILPELDVLDVEPARAAIRREFLTNIVRAKGIDRVRGHLDSDIVPTPAVVLEAVGFLAGSRFENGLMVVEVGGATTNVHSFAPDREEGGVVRRGLPEPELSRTVEGDLGVRWNADTILELGRDWLSQQSTDPAALEEWVARVRTAPSTIPATALEREHDRLLAAFAAKTAIARHCGRHHTVMLPDGPVTVRDGRDLREIDLLVGTGGSVIAAESAVLHAALSGDDPLALVPSAPELAIDNDYLLYAVGLLREPLPEEAEALAVDGLSTAINGLAA